jgi:hypothetical protein
MLDESATNASCRSAGKRQRQRRQLQRAALYRPRCTSCRTRISPQWDCSRRGPASVSSAQPQKRARTTP